MKNTTIILFALLLTACQSGNNNQEQATAKQSAAYDGAPEAVVNDHSLAGLWRGVLQSPGGELPFGIQLTRTADGYSAKILNGSEQADTSAVLFDGQQVEIQFDWYDARIRASLSADGQSMQGEWSKTAAEQISRLPFLATRGYTQRFGYPDGAAQITGLAGIWQAEFVDEDGPSVAVGEFLQSGPVVKGTFLTPTGDYRFLAGHAMNGQLKLSAFDGAHAFLFTAQVQADGSLKGDFWSRDTYHASWQAELNEQAHEVLPDSWEMVQLTREDKRVAFAFEDLNGQLVQLTDERFKDKAVLINIFGTWCPNCNDEAPVLAQFHQQYRDQGFEVVGLAFEYTGDAARDRRQLKRFKQRYGIDYPLLLAGTNDKQQAAEVLGFIDQVVAYPTSLFLDRDHQVVGIHSGFAGPGTGEHYTRLVKKLEDMIISLL